MKGNKADQFEAALQQAAQGKRIEGEMADLIETARLASRLAEPPPPPPRGLNPGRQRFLAEAARLRARKSARPSLFSWSNRRFGLVGVLVATILVVGLVFGAGQAAADSLPGELLYPLKLAGEATRLKLTTGLEAKTELAVDLAERRLDEIVAMLEEGRMLTEQTSLRSQEQLALAMHAINQLEGEAAVRAAQRLGTGVQARQQVMVQALLTAPKPEQEALRTLLREIERVRQQLHSGQNEPDGEQNRQRQGAPKDPADQLDAISDPTDRPVRPTVSHRSVEPKPTEDQVPGSDPQPTEEPAGPKPTEDPDSGPSPQPTDKPAEPEPTQDPGSRHGPHPTETPPGPEPTDDPGSGNDPSPTSKPPGPKPTDDPGSRNIPNPTSKPPGPKPTDDPGSGHDSDGQGSGGGSRGNP